MKLRLYIRRKMKIDAYWHRYKRNAESWSNLTNNLS